LSSVYSCAHVAILSRAHEFFGIRSVEEKMKYAVNSVSSMDKANIKKGFFPVFAGDYQKVYMKSSNIRIEKFSGRNEMMLPEGVRNALALELGNSVRLEIKKVRK